MSADAEQMTSADVTVAGLSWPDYVILAVFLAISLGIGVYHSLTGGRQRTTQEFIMANRRLRLLPTALSLFVSFQSAIAIMAMTAEMYSYGVQMLVMAPIAVVIGLLITERLFVPWMFRMKIVSVNEYFERRFHSKSVRILGSVLSILAGVIYMGVAMFAPSVALEAAVGFPTVVSIPLIAVVCVAYTALGGMRAVIWTDVFQCGIMMGGILAILIKGIIAVGGINRVFELCGEEGRLLWLVWSANPTERHTVWTFVFGYSINYLYAYGVAQPSVQRFSATYSLAHARGTILLNIPALWLLYFTTSLLGLTVIAYYAMVDCDPLANARISNPNQLLPYFVTTLFANAHGFSGLFLATLYGGALSSVSSALSGTAANCWEDILSTKYSHLSEITKAVINRLLVVLFGFLSTGIAFLASVAPGTINQVSLAFGGSVGGPLFGLFVLGGISRRSNWKGALAGGITAFAINMWLNVGSLRMKRHHPTFPLMSADGCLETYVDQMASGSGLNSTSHLDHISSTFTTESILSVPNNTLSVTTEPEYSRSGFETLYSISYLWYVPLGMLITVLVGLLISLLTADADEVQKVDERTLFPFREMLSFKSDTVNDENQDDGDSQKPPYFVDDANAASELKSLRKKEDELESEKKPENIDANRKCNRTENRFM